jgi:thiol-disulfide isomerase/thioredoxin
MSKILHLQKTIKCLLTFTFISAGIALHSQTEFFDDFEGYKTKTPLPLMDNPAWQYAPATYTITDEKSSSGNKSLRLTWTEKPESVIYKIPSFNESVEINFKLWKLEGETFSISAFQSFGFLRFESNNTLTAFESPESNYFEYKSEQWTDVKIQYFKDTKIIKYFVDNRFVANFVSKVNKTDNIIINLDKSTYSYIDDFSVRTIQTSDLSVNLAMLDINIPGLEMAGNKVKLQFSVVNLGLNPIDGFIINMKYGNTESQTIIQKSLNFSEVYKPDILPEILIEPGTQQLELSVIPLGLSDENPEDNSLSTQIRGVQPKGKKVLLEYCTGTWCGSCPAAIVSYRLNKAKFKDNIECVFMHFSDVMALPEYTFPQVEGIPDLFIDRYQQRQLFNQFPIFKSLDEPAIVAIRPGVAYYRDTKEVYAESTVTFLQAYDQPIYHSFLIVEDSVRNTGYYYGQANFYSGGVLGPMGGFENMPTSIPATDMVYSNVPRLLINGLNGKKFNVRAEEGESFTLSEKIPFDISKINDRFYIYHIIYDIDRKVINVNKAKISEVLRTITSTTLEALSHSGIYPNPATEYVEIIATKPINNIQIIDEQGKKIIINAINSGENKYKLDLNTLSPGVYMLQIISDDEIQVKKIIKL